LHAMVDLPTPPFWLNTTRRMAVSTVLLGFQASVAKSRTSVEVRPKRLVFESYFGVVAGRSGNQRLTLACLPSWVFPQRFTRAL